MQHAMQHGCRRLAVRPSRVLAVLLALACAACVPAGAGERAATSPSSSPTPSVIVHQHHAATVPATPATPVELRLRLEQLLGHHAILMVRRMRGSIDGERAFIVAAQGVLDRNTDELTSAVTDVYGAATGAAFKRAWTEHIQELSDYSDALAHGDKNGQRRARAALDAYAADYGKLMASATKGRLRADAVAKDVAAHIDHLLRQADAYAAKDYPRAFQLEREAYAGMFSTGRNLAGAMETKPSGELPAAFDSPPQRLRSALGQLLGEHAELAFDATRAVVAGSPTAVPAARALDANTRDVIAAMQAALGRAAANEFGPIWASHIDALVAFSVAVARSDETAQAAARARIDHFPGELGQLLPQLSGGRVGQVTVLAALREHDQQLLQQVTAYAAKDYPHAHDIAYAGYDHMFAVASTLADVLEGHAAATVPRGGANTGGGGSASDVGAAGPGRRVR